MWKIRKSRRSPPLPLAGCLPLSKDISVSAAQAFFYSNASWCKCCFSCVFLFAVGIVHLFESSTVLFSCDFPTAIPFGRNLAPTAEKADKLKPFRYLASYLQLCEEPCDAPGTCFPRFLRWGWNFRTRGASQWRNKRDMFLRGTRSRAWVTFFWPAA